jgi:hypothetical protein
VDLEFPLDGNTPLRSVHVSFSDDEIARRETTRTLPGKGKIVEKFSRAFFHRVSDALHRRRGDIHLSINRGSHTSTKSSMFNSASNISISGGTFSTFPGQSGQYHGIRGA